jgi:glycosyltransferase involved in cell wall biosynthesis
VEEFTEPPTPTAESLREVVFASGTAAEHAFGVLYQGEHETLWDGTGVAVRLHARALASTGLPLLLKSFSNVVINENGIAEPLHVVGLDPKLQEQVGALRNSSIATLVPLIKHLVVRDADHLRNVIYPKGVVAADMDQLMQMRESVARATILYTVWEREKIDPAIAKHLARVAECWVPCEDNAAMLRRAGVQRVHVVPHPYDPADPLCTFRATRRPLAQRRFYSIGAWQPRKGYDRLLGAFLLAFRPGDDVHLTLKISGGQWPSYEPPEAALGRWLQDKRVVQRGWTYDSLQGYLRVATARLPQPVIQRMHYENNIYVSSSHGEAWCLPAFDAKLAGNRLVHVPFGGTKDFAGPGDVAVPMRPGPVHPSYRWEADATWADYEVEELAAALQTAEAPTTYELPPGFEQRFQLGHVGQQMAERVLAVVTATQIRLAEAYLRSQVRPWLP